MRRHILITLKLPLDSPISTILSDMHAHKKSMDQQSYGPPRVVTYLVSVSLLTVKVEKKVSKFVQHMSVIVYACTMSVQLMLDVLPPFTTSTKPQSRVACRKCR
jgi:hypothetical protein